MNLASHHCPPENRKFVIIVAFLASAMGFIDGSVVAIALPQIRAALDATFVEAQWVSNAYILTLSAFILLAGGVADRLGVKRVFNWGVWIFVGTSLACAFAWDSFSLIVFRALQGFGAAIMLPGSMALIARNFPRAERGRAMGLWIASSSITTAMGPLFGGFLLTYGGADAWRWIFAINLPIGLLAIWILWLKVPTDTPKSTGGIADLDWTGGFLLTLSMGLLATGLTFLDSHEFAALAPALLGGGVVVASVAIFWELRVPNAMIDMRLFKSAEFSGVNVMTFLVWICMGGVTFFLPMMVIISWNLPPTYAGSMFLPFSILITLFSPFVGRLVDRFGTRRLLTMGSLTYTLGCLAFALAIFHREYWFGLLPGFAILGLGIGMMGSTISAAVINAVPEDKTGAASGINNMVARLSFLFAVAGLGAFVSFLYRDTIQASGLHVDVQNLMIEAGFGERLKGALYQISTVELQAKAMDHAMIILCLVLAGIAFSSTLVGLLSGTSVDNEELIEVN